MAAAQQELTFAIKAVNEAQRALNEVKGQIDDVGKKAEEGHGKLGNFGGALSGVASIAGGFVLGQGILKAPGFLLDAAKAAADDEAATARLNQTLRTLTDESGKLGPTFAEASKGVNDLIDKGQKLAFTDDDVRDSFQFLVAATGDVSEAMGRQQAAMDLARGANIPLAQATKMLGKLNGENVEVFKKLGITLGENATEADALAAVQGKFGGQAEAYAKSTAGQFAQAKIAMGEIVEGIGGAVLPILAKLGTTLAANLPAIQAFVGELGVKVAGVVAPALEGIIDVAGRLATFFVSNVVPVIADFWETDVAPKVAIARDVIGELAGKAAELAGVIADKLQGPLTTVLEFIGNHKEILAAAAIVIGGVLVASFTAWAVAAGAAAVSTALALAPVLLIGAALTALVAAIILVVQHWDEITAKFPVLGTIADAIEAKLNEFTGWITGSFVPAVQGIYDAISKAVGDAIAFVQQHWDEIRAIIEPALQALVVIIETQVNLWKVAIETVLGVIKGIVDVFMGVFTGDWDRAWGGVKQIVDSVWNGIKGTIETVIGAIKNLAPLMKEAGSALLDAFWEGMKGIGGKLEEVIESIGKGIANGVIAIVNQAINKINDMIPDKIALTGLPDIDLPDNPIPNIPALAKGGIVTRPTLALVGEAGPEAVIPLNRAGGVGASVTIVALDSQSFVDWLKRNPDAVDAIVYEANRRGGAA